MQPFLQHAVEASLPVLKICLLGAVGALLARTGILDPQGRKPLSKLIYCLFTPALTFSKLAPVLSAAHLVAWLPLVVNMFVSVAVGLLLGGLLLVVIRPPAGLRAHTLVATGLGNAGNLPLVLVAALIRETGGKLFGGQVLSEDLAIAYVALGIWAATVTHFTIGNQLLKLPPDQQQQSAGMQEQQHQPADASKHHRRSLDAHNGAVAAVSGSESGAACVVELGAVRSKPGQHDAEQHSIPLHDSDQPSHQQEHMHLLAGTPAGSSSDTNEAWQQHQHQHQHHKQPLPLHQQHQQRHLGSSSGSSGSGWRGKVREAAGELTGQLASPPMVGCMAAVAVGLVPPLRDQLFAAEGQLLMIRDCIAMFGDCCIPCLLLMLGATLSKGPGKAKLPCAWWWAWLPHAWWCCLFLALVGWCWQRC